MAVFEHRLRVRFHDADPAGIVFFANILVYCHEAYEELLRQGGMPLHEFLGKRDQSLPLGHAEVDFNKPIRFGQEIAVRVSVGRIGERSFRLEYELSTAEGELSATAATAHICIDRQSGQSAPLPQELKVLLQRYAKPA